MTIHIDLLSKVRGTGDISVLRCMICSKNCRNARATFFFLKSRDSHIFLIMTLVTGTVVWNLFGIFEFHRSNTLRYNYDLLCTGAGSV
jgi:hypothetical protein